MFSDPQMKLSPTEPESKQQGHSNNWNFCEKEKNYNHKTSACNGYLEQDGERRGKKGEAKRRKQEERIKRERRVEAEIETQGKVWTERKGRVSTVCNPSPEIGNSIIFCHMIMKTKKISITPRSLPRGEPLSVHISKSTRIQKSLVRECTGLHIT